MISIAIPLLAMLLLTLLVGVTAFRITSDWQLGASKIVQRTTEVVLLNNTRNTLEKISVERTSNPDLAQQHWKECQQQIFLLQQNTLNDSTSPNEQTINLLQAFLAQRDNISHIDAFLTQGINISLGNLQQDLQGVGQYSNYVAIAVTACMLLLGIILTTITAWDLSRLLKALVQSRDLNIRLQEEERRRIAQELHDGVMQELIDLKRSYAPEKLNHIVQNLHRVCQNLKPQILDDLGLRLALELLADDLRDSGIQQVHLAVDTSAINSLPEEYELPLFRVIQESFSNIRKHANASEVSLSLAFQNSSQHVLIGIIEDNGSGFKAQNLRKQHPNGHQSVTASSGMGLRGMQERIQQLGGNFFIESKAGKGCRSRFLIPLHSAKVTKR